MSLRDKIQSSLGPKLDGVLADAVEPFEAKRETVGEYDPVTGTTPTTVETFTGRWTRSTWSRRELDSQHIESTDLKRIVMQNETNWQPQIGDIANGYRVQDFQQDGAEATWTVQLRKT